MLVLPRHKAIIPFLTAAILIPTDQVIVIGSLHFMMLRVLILFGLVVIFRSKMSSNGTVFSGGINGIDRAVILCTIFTSLNWVLLWQESAAVTFQLGEIYTIFGVYLLLRCLIRNREDIELTIRSFAYIAVVVAIVMTYEHVNRLEPICLLGGARAYFYASLMVREGGLRATGCLGHPILAGTLQPYCYRCSSGCGVTKRKHRAIALAGMIAGYSYGDRLQFEYSAASVCSRCSGLCFWPLRNQMRLIRWGIFAYADFAPHSDESSGLAFDIANRCRRWLLWVSPLRTGQSVYPSFWRLVAARRQGQWTVGLADVGYSEPICGNRTEFRTPTFHTFLINYRLRLQIRG